MWGGTGRWCWCANTGRRIIGGGDREIAALGINDIGVSSVNCVDLISIARGGVARYVDGVGQTRCLDTIRQRHKGWRPIDKVDEINAEDGGVGVD